MFLRNQNCVPYTHADRGTEFPYYFHPLTVLFKAHGAVPRRRKWHVTRVSLALTSVQNISNLPNLSIRKSLTALDYFVCQPHARAILPDLNTNFFQKLTEFHCRNKNKHISRYRTLFIYQLTHTTLRSVELLKHSKIDKNAGVHTTWPYTTCLTQYTVYSNTVHDTHAVTG